MRRSGSLFIVGIIIFLLDFYIFSSLGIFTKHSSETLRLTVYSIHWVLSATAILSLFLFPYLQSVKAAKVFLNYLMVIIVGLVLAKLIVAAFLLLDDIRRLILLGLQLLGSASAEGGNKGGTLERSMLLTSLGLCIGTALFLAMIYGFSNKYTYRVKQVRLRFPNLPQGFKGFRFIQISDIHSGSLLNKKRVDRGVDLLLKQDPEMVLFTGDLVNDRAVEMTGYVEIFSRIKAPMGVFSTLGNHDYGDYYWGVNPVGERAMEKARNLENLKAVHQRMGWRLLMNEHVVLKRNGDEIALLGIENWGAKAGFPKYGKMSSAYQGTEKYRFKILMSHDPSHWQAEVQTKYPDIDLTLSGHTHGMQFGIELPGLKWSPVQWVYKQWAGLYEAGNQKLYVNRGFGFIGYPGRVGILPEITVFELE